MLRLLCGVKYLYSIKIFAWWHRTPWMIWCCTRFAAQKSVLKFSGLLKNYCRSGPNYPRFKKILPDLHVVLLWSRNSAKIKKILAVYIVKLLILCAWSYYISLLNLKKIVLFLFSFLTQIFKYSIFIIFRNIIFKLEWRSRSFG